MAETVTPIYDTRGNVIGYELNRTEITPDLYMPEDKRIDHLAGEALAVELLEQERKP